MKSGKRASKKKTKSGARRVLTHPLESLRSEVGRLVDEFAPMLSPLGRRAFDTGAF